jgi:eukaryotic-like serine/threonine-protein kinase
MASEHDERLGISLGGKYKILRFLAEGGMGSVYEAVHVVVKRRFAVKFLRADLTQRRDALLRFQREAAAAGALESENIAAVVDFGIAEDGSPYIVMEYLVGCDLAGLLNSEGPLAIERATDIVFQACLGVKEAHAAGVIHRDLKPENLFLCRRSDGSDLVKILDFGIAKLQASNAGNAVTGTGGVVGTPSYMSPEQASGSTLIDERTDVYALGVILYQLLSGRTPHPGDSYNAVIYHISTQPSLPLECEGRELPESLVEIVQRTIARSPADRPASAEELSQQLSPYARREVWPVLAHDSDRPSPLDAVRPVAQSFLESPEATTDDPKAPRRGRSVLVAAGLALLTVMLAGGYFAAHSGDSRLKPEGKGTPTGQAAVVAATSAALVANSDQLPINHPTAANSPLATSLQPTPSHASPDRTNLASSVDFGDNTKRPLVTLGRPRGRPQGPASAAQAPSASKPVTSNAIHATFDSRNPYE